MGEKGSPGMKPCPEDTPSSDVLLESPGWLTASAVLSGALLRVLPLSGGTPEASVLSAWKLTKRLSHVGRRNLGMMVAVNEKPEQHLVMTASLPIVRKVRRRIGPYIAWL